MSATLPKIHGIDVGTDAQFEPLIKDVQSRYLQNPNFKDRIAFDFSLIDKYTNISVEELAHEVILKSSEYAKNHGSVHTIIEFIYKKSTTEFFEEIKDNQLFSNENIVVLSGTILEPRRKEIIGFLKDSNNRNKNILLITTQVVEAGVDIDMDLGFKNISLLDNDEQLAGRINRNAKKEKCCLYLFKKDMPFRIYKNDFRYNFSKSLYDDPRKRQQILENKDFNLLYDLVLDYINDNNKLEFTKNFKDYISYIDNLLYDKVNEEFRLINNDSVSFFVPLNIELKLDESGNSSFFSKLDIEFLKKNNCIHGEKIIGEKVWLLYDSIIKQEKGDFLVQKINLKMLGGILSNFTFSMFNNDKLLNNLKPFLEYKEGTDSYKINGYYCFNSYYSKVYDFKKGLHENHFDADLCIF
jgi:CRISPR-associated endonuclease/helicase Cas3